MSASYPGIDTANYRMLVLRQVPQQLGHLSYIGAPAR
jgi:hypothetical protein